MKKTYEVFMTELVTYKKTVEASSRKDALEIAQAEYGFKDAVSRKNYGNDKVYFSQLSQ